MDRQTIDEALERVRASDAYGWPARLAPELPLLDSAVGLRLTTWTDVANTLGISRNTLNSARAGAAKLIQKWEAAGITPDNGGAGKSSGLAPAKTTDIQDQAEPEAEAESDDQSSHLEAMRRLKKELSGKK